MKNSIKTELDEIIKERDEIIAQRDRNIAKILENFKKMVSIVKSGGVSKEVVADVKEHISEFKKYYPDVLANIEI